MSRIELWCTLIAVLGLQCAFGQRGPLTSVVVRLAPHTESVGTSTTVSFAIPLPPSLLFDSTQVRVSNGQGIELPAFVRSLGPWRSIPPTPFLCSAPSQPGQPGLRSVLIQFEYTFPSADTVPITVELNRLRTLHRPAETPVQNTWRQVREGTYAATFNLFEPLVYALLEPEWLTCSGIDTLPSRAGSVASLASSDEGQAGFFLHVTNNFNPYPDVKMLVNFQGDYEPWLYDRAQTFFNQYVRTGELQYLREGHRAVQHYLRQLYMSGDCPGIPVESCVGFFKLKNPDPAMVGKDAKYSYNESLATEYWLTGDPQALARIPDIRSATITGFAPTSPITLARAATFTERDFAFSLLAAVMEYEVSGSAGAATQAADILTNLHGMQQNPLNSQPANGCFLYHPDEVPSEWGFSPWMSSILGHALLRAYHTLSDVRAREILINLADCVSRRGVYYGPVGASSRWTTYYLGTADGVPWELTGIPSSSGADHAIDLGFLVAMGAHLSSDPEQAGRLLATAQRLVETHSGYLVPALRNSGNWEGSGAPQYRANPPRKYNWWYKNSGAIGTVLNAASPGLAAVNHLGGPLAVNATALEFEVRLRQPAATGGLAVSLGSSDAALIPVPGSIVIPAGQVTGRFTVNLGSTAVRKTVRVNAYAGQGTVFTDVSAGPVALLAIAANPYVTGAGRTTTTNRVTLSGPAPSGGVSVAMASTDATIAAPAPTVDVPAGTTTTNFSVVIPERSTSATVRLIGTLGGDTRTAPLTVERLRINSMDVPGYLAYDTTSSSFRVYLNADAPAGGAVVALSTPHPSLISVPPSVTIPAGALSAVFSVTAASTGPTEAAAARIDATYLGVTASGSVLTGPPQLTQINLSPSTLSAGGSTSGSRVYLNVAAPVGGVAVRLTSLSPGAVSVPNSMTIPQGATSAVFTVTSFPTGETQPVRVTADLNGIVRGDTITVLSSGVPPLRLVMAAQTISGGSTSTAHQVLLNSPAPAGGAHVQLTSSNPNVASVPQAVSIAAGTTSATFNVQSSAVSTPESVTINASWQTHSAVATLSVVPAILAGIELGAAQVTGGKALVGNRILLSSTAPASGYAVALSSSNPQLVQVPAIVNVALGSSSSELFNLATFGTNVDVPVTITATLPGESKVAQILVRPSHPVTLVTPATLVSGKTGTATVTLDAAAPAGGLNVSLVSSHPQVAAVPASVTIQPGTLSSTFSVSASPVVANTAVTFSASTAGGSASDTTNVVAPSLSSVTLSPATLGAGSVSTANKGNLTGTAGEPLVILLSAAPAGSATVPASVTVPAGATSASFNLTAGAVSASTTVTVTAAYAGLIRTKTMTVDPVSLSTLTLSPATTLGGKTTTANKVTLNAPAPAGGFPVTFSSNASAAAPAATLVVPAGQSSATFPIVLSAVPSTTVATITASAAGKSKAATLTITPPLFSSLVLSPATTIGSTTTTSNRVSLTGAAPPGGVNVAFTSSNPALAAVPSQVTIPAGATSATFPVVTAVVSMETVVAMTATAATVTKPANLTLTPIKATTVLLSPLTTTGGKTTTGNRVVINKVAPPGGFAVQLSSSNPSAASVPATVTVAAGSTSAYFPIQIAPTSISRQITISASAGGATASNVLTVSP